MSPYIGIPLLLAEAREGAVHPPGADLPLEGGDHCVLSTQPGSRSWLQGVIPVHVIAHLILTTTLHRGDNFPSSGGGEIRDTKRLSPPSKETGFKMAELGSEPTRSVSRAATHSLGGLGFGLRL